MKWTRRRGRNCCTIVLQLVLTDDVLHKRRHCVNDTARSFAISCLLDKLRACLERGDAPTAGTMVQCIYKLRGGRGDAITVELQQLYAPTCTTLYLCD